MTYNGLVKEAEKVYSQTAKHSTFCAIYDVRKYIASKIDLCSDRNKHLDVLEWEEYKRYYAPMTKKEYAQRKKAAKKSYMRQLAIIEQEWNSKGINSPDYHKI